MSSSKSQEKPEVFRHATANVSGLHLHYVFAGAGEPVLLLPGWPQNWFAWRAVLVQLVAAGRQVFALDPRGFGDSDKPIVGYDLATSAKDIHGFLSEVGLVRIGGIDVIAHDLGCWLAYAHADRYPEEVKRLVVIEATIPGAKSPSGYPDEETNKKTWQFAFNRLVDLPELLIGGHEREYLEWLFTNKAAESWQVEEDALSEYVRVLQIPGVVRATCSYYREVFSTAGQDAMKARLERKLHMPIFAIGGGSGVGISMLQSMQVAGTDVDGVVLNSCGHFIPEEDPTALTRHILDFWVKPCAG